MGIGLLLGLITVASAIYVEPLLTRQLATPRAYISLSVHGLPALLGGLCGVLLAAVSEAGVNIFLNHEMINRSSEQKWTNIRQFSQ